ncbi:hypothetical protein SOASR030_20150 [Leminorella grimontii]|uniref:Uncharacterized protein n=1 Tax=Leminorella grimontii TaxID=82981 RepID=A0AAV5N1D2_9GAMM|nr:hypothetical protein SOASR030_20150 [Leminorella grimontii]
MSANNYAANGPFGHAIYDFAFYWGCDVREKAPRKNQDAKNGK